jgi:hypothetical protein
MSRNFLYLIFSAFFLINCSAKNKTGSGEDKEDLMLLERKSLEAEFALDTGYISTLIHQSFVEISEEGTHNKPQYLAAIYSNIEQRLKDSVFVDSFRFENEIVNFYDNTAFVTFVVHTFKKSKGVANQKRTRFFDVWVKEKNDWQLVASQGTPVKE